MLSTVIRWIAENWMEVLATVLGLLYIIYSIKQNPVCWLFGILSSALYVFLTLKNGLYADMGLYVYYVLIGFYGWYEWIYGNPKDKSKNLEISSLNLRLTIILGIVALALFIGIALVLKKYTNSNVPYLDSFTTSLSIVATWMLARKILQHWIVWIVVDLVSIGLYFYKELYFTIILFAVYTLLAFSGYFKWKSAWEN